MCKYSIVVRTLGYGGSKYQALLDSIAKQTIAPEHIYVIIADGYDLPKESIGTEEYVYSKKGMLYQRVFGIRYAIENSNSDILLCLDDDVAFESDYAEKALQIINEQKCDMLMPVVLDKDGNSGLVEHVSRIPSVSSIIGVKRISSKSDFRIKVLNTGGFMVNPTLRGEVPTQSCHGTGFWIKMSRISELKLEEELWIDECHYAFPEDQVIGYKAYLSGLKTIYSTNLQHHHLDAGTSVTTNKMYHQGIAGGRNYIIFWHRFIFPQSSSISKKMKDIMSISWRIGAVGIQKLISSILSMNFSRIRGYLQGVGMGIKYITSEDYKKLSPIKRLNT